MKISYFILLTLLGLMAASCSHRQDVPQGAPVQIVRLDSILREVNPALFPGQQGVADTFFRTLGISPQADSAAIEAYATARSTLFFAPAVDSVWSDLRPLETDLGNLKARMAESLPAVRFPAVATVISPYNQSVFTVDTVLYVALNHYLGADYAPYGHFPEYLRARKIPVRVVPDVAETVIRRDYPFEHSADTQALNAMLYEGAVVETMMRTAGVGEAEAIGYDESAAAWAEANEAKVWETLLTRKMLFSTDPSLQRALVGLAPTSSVVNPEAPGQIGRYIGHRIVTAYLKANPEAALEELLSPGFYNSQQTLSKSGYSPF